MYHQAKMINQEGSHEKLRHIMRYRSEQAKADGTDARSAKLR